MYKIKVMLYWQLAQDTKFPGVARGVRGLKHPILTLLTQVKLTIYCFATLSLLWTQASSIFKLNSQL